MGPRLFAIALLASCAACPPGPSAGPAPGPDAGAVVDPTCANLVRLGCGLGADPMCAYNLGLAASENHATAEAIRCARTATSLTALAACGPNPAHPYFACSGP